MRGIVAEVNGKNAIILTPDGSFRKVKATASWIVGSEVDLEQPARNIKVIRRAARISSIAAAALLVLGIGYGAYTYATPYSYVDIDINPSIELTANVYDRIIKAEALNEDGTSLLESQRLKNARLQEGVAQILSVAVEQGYLNTENSNMTVADDTVPVISSAVLFTVSSLDGLKSGELKKELADRASKELDKDSVKSEVLSGEASVEQRNSARKFGLTPGKLALIEDALEDNPQLKMEDLKKTAVKDLVEKARDKIDVADKQAAGIQGRDAGETGAGENNKKAGAPGEEKALNQKPASDAQNSEQNPGREKKNETPGSKDNQNGQEKSFDQKGRNKTNGQNGKNSANEKAGGNNVKDGNNGNGQNQQKRQDVADILAREKEQRQKLKDELLDNRRDNVPSVNGKQEEHDRQIKDRNEDTKKDEAAKSSTKGKLNPAGKKKNGEDGSSREQSEENNDKGRQDSKGKGMDKKK